MPGSGFGFGFWRTASPQVQTIVVLGWILATGFWDDTGSWEDTAVWID